MHNINVLIMYQPLYQFLCVHMYFDYIYEYLNGVHLKSLLQGFESQEMGKRPEATSPELVPQLFNVNGRRQA